MAGSKIESPLVVEADDVYLSSYR